VTSEQVGNKMYYEFCVNIILPRAIWEPDLERLAYYIIPKYVIKYNISYTLVQRKR